MVNKYTALLESVSQKIENYNSKISSGLRLTPEESDDLSKATKLFPILDKLKKIQEDLDYAIDNKNDFNESFLDDLNNKKNDVENSIDEMLIALSKEEINEFIIELRAGAGGEEASLFVKDLFSAYTKYLKNKNINFDILELSDADSGGYSTLIAQIYSPLAYELLKNEGGVHRVQRIPKTESSGRIHTSTISIALLPIYKKPTVEINQNDLIIDVYRSSGHGGQSVNTTDSAVRITHIPSGLVVTCQNTKSQIKNKEMALKVLLARLEDIQRTSATKNLQEIRNKQIQNSERAEKIRTYNYLQDRITDHRVKLDFSNIPKFMEGEIEPILKEINQKLLLEENS